MDAFASMPRLLRGIGAVSVDEKRITGKYLSEVMCVQSRYIILYDAAGDRLSYDAAGLF